MAAQPSGNASETARKGWDRDEYAARAREREGREREEGRARHEAAAEGRRYYRKQLDPDTARETSSRAERLNVAANVGKIQLVPAGSSGTGKRGRSAGFYCDACDLTFKDNLQYVEHLNSKQHLVNVGEKSEVRRATLEEVQERIRWLAEKRRKEMEEEGLVDLQARLQKNIDEDERKREERRRKRREKRRKTNGGIGHQNDQEPIRGGIIC